MKVLVKVKTIRTRFLIPLALAGLFAACAPNPRRQLTPDERVSDMMWLTSKVEANYAPLTYKEELHGFDYEKKKAEYLELAQKEQSNQAFYLLMKKFVAEFKDGHMSARFNKSSLPGRAKIAFLGFTGHRNGDVFKVKKFFPTFTEKSNYPVKEGDEITHINGIELKEAVKEKLQPYRDVGNQEANYTILMPSLFARDSMSMPLPENDEVTLTVKRSSKTFDVTVPWVVQDAYEFSQNQKKAAKKAAEAKGIDFDKEKAKVESLAKMASAHPYVTESFIKNSILKKGKEIKTDEILQELAKLGPTNTFEVSAGSEVLKEIEFYSLLSGKIQASETENKKTTIEKLKESRYVPGTVFPFEGAKTYPAYVSVQKKDDKRHAVGYIRIDTFSPDSAEGDVIKEFKKTLEFFRDFGVSGVDKIVIDLIDNGGGSLKLGLRMAALLSSKAVDMPSMKYMLNDSWMDQYEQSSMVNVDDAARTISQRAYGEMLGMFRSGERLSSEMSVDTLYPFIIKPNKDLKVLKKPFDFEIVVATNEMCASMCDIFSSILKENKMAKFVGQKTMGAGGNVVQHYFAPNSGMMVNLTESLVVSSSGKYLENNGVEPDVEMAVNEDKGDKYKDVLKKAFELLIK